MVIFLILFVSEKLKNIFCNKNNNKVVIYKNVDLFIKLLNIYYLILLNKQLKFTLNEAR